MKKRILIVLVVIVLGIQLVPVDRSNPAVAGTIDAPPEVQDILKRACFDCHSNETKWPWYSYVAPVSWLVADDVEEGREHLNFSEWSKASEKDRRHMIEEVGEEVEEGEMPLDKYVWLHSEADLTDAEKQTLVTWAKQNGGEKDEAEEERKGE
ncbi:MAG: heme-binding domain-containing protein [Planctomycetota bacterium]